MHGCTSHIILNKPGFSCTKFLQCIFYIFRKTPFISVPGLLKNIYVAKKHFITLTFFFLFFGLTTPAQNKITGVVRGTGNLPLDGATVINKSINVATFTNADGSYTIAAKKGDVLDISFIGYKSRQIEIGNDVIINVFLEESVINLDEIFVTGYTTQRVKEITGSVAIVKTKDLTAVPAGQVEQMLQGRVAGLNVITSGMPGGGSNVRLHGIGNFGDVTPLYIIDGVQGNINNLNPNDIESLQVLKDAGAYSIYGVRGANGVIIITTRNGRIGKTKVSYDFYIGTTRPLHKGPDLLNPQEMADLTWLALEIPGRLRLMEIRAILTMAMGQSQYYQTILLPGPTVDLLNRISCESRFIQFGFYSRGYLPDHTVK